MSAPRMVRANLGGSVEAGRELLHAPRTLAGSQQSAVEPADAFQLPADAAAFDRAVAQTALRFQQAPPARTLRSGRLTHDWDATCLGFTRRVLGETLGVPAEGLPLMLNGADPSGAGRTACAKFSLARVRTAGVLHTRDWRRMTPGSLVYWDGGKYGHVAVNSGLRDERGLLLVNTGWKGFAGVRLVPLAEVSERLGARGASGWVRASDLR